MFNSIRSAFRVVALIIAAYFAALPVAAQSPVADITMMHIEAEAKETGEVLVSATVLALDDQKVPVTGLQPNNFTIVENNVAIAPDALTVALAEAPINVALLIDTSSSMANPDASGVRAIDRAKDAAIAFIDRLKKGDQSTQGDQVAIFEYNSRVNIAQAFTYDHNRAIDEGVINLNARQDDDAACLYDALLEVTKQTAELQQGQRTIIILTGNPNSDDESGCNDTTVDDVLGAATGADGRLPIFTIGFGNTLNQDELTLLARLTGGQALRVPDPGNLSTQFELILNQLHNQYHLSYPSLASGSLAEVTVTENESGQSDMRRLLIPAAIEPTPTPIPQFSINLVSKPPLEGEETITINVEIPEEVTLEKTELFVNNTLLQKAIDPPFNLFTIDINKLGSGIHNVRVEATDTHGITSSAETQLTLSIPPTPVPATPLPTVSANAKQEENSNTAAIFRSTPMLSLFLILAGLIVLLLFVVFFMYVLFFYGKQQKQQPVPIPPEPVTLPAVQPMITVDEAQSHEKTWHEIPGNIPPTLKANLKVVDGQNLLSQATFPLTKQTTNIGRNMDVVLKDIHIDDRRVSRLHAKITHQDYNFFIQDLASTAGTIINGTKIPAYTEIELHRGDIIKIGQAVTFQVDIVDLGQTLLEDAPGPDTNKTLLDNQIDPEPGKTVLEGPFDVEPDMTLDISQDAIKGIFDEHIKGDDEGTTDPLYRKK